MDRNTDNHCDDSAKHESIRTCIWQEEALPDHPFVAEICRLRGYDVYGDLLGKASWTEVMYLLLFAERPDSQQRELLESLAIILAHPGLRDSSVRAAMNAAVGGSTRASALMAALGVGAGGAGGARELYLSVERAQSCGTDLARWQAYLDNPPKENRADVWPEPDYVPGFAPQSHPCPLWVQQALDHLAMIAPDSPCCWLARHRPLLEKQVGRSLSIIGVVAQGFVQLQLDVRQAEMLFLFLRLPGAAAQALEQEKFGWMKYPFWKNGIILTDDPGPPLQASADDISAKEDGHDGHPEFA